MPDTVTSENAGELKKGAPLIAKFSALEDPDDPNSDSIEQLVGGPMESWTNSLTLLDFVRYALDADGNPIIPSETFDLDDSATCKLLSTDRKDRRRFRWTPSNRGTIPIYNDPEKREIPKGYYDKYMACTLRVRPPSLSGGTFELTGFVIDGVYDQMACILIYKTPGIAGNNSSKSRIAFFVSAEMTELE